MLLLLRGLASLATDLLALVTHALPLVRFRFADGTHFGGELTNLLPVGALDRNVRLIGAGHRQASRNLLVNFVGTADPQLQRVARHGGEVTDALDFELLLVTGRNALDHV